MDIFCITEANYAISSSANQGSSTINHNHDYYFTSNTINHIIYGEIKGNVKNPKTNDTLYTIKRFCNEEGRSLNKEEQITITITGCHTHDLIHQNKARFKEKKQLVTILPTGEKIYKGKIEIKLEELEESGNGWKVKKGFSTFWPESWSIEKIKEVTLDAYLSPSKKVKDSKWIAKTSNGVEITGFFDKNSGVITTTYITTNEYNSF